MHRSHGDTWRKKEEAYDAAEISRIKRDVFQSQDYDVVGMLWVKIEFFSACDSTSSEIATKS